MCFLAYTKRVPFFRFVLGSDSTHFFGCAALASLFKNCREYLSITRIELSRSRNDAKVSRSVLKERLGG
jgi:hypothetical protein